MLKVKILHHYRDKEQFRKAYKKYIYECDDSDFENLEQSLLIVSYLDQVIRVEEDGGAPEDQSLIRNWSWVKDAILEAYKLGKEENK